MSSQTKADRTEQDRTEGTVVATAACLSSQLTPPSPRGSTEERGGLSAEGVSVRVCALKKEEQRERECVCVCVGVSDLCSHV